MQRKFLTPLIALSCAAALAGCGTVPHGNAILFGTDTSFGINAGTSATGTTPQVSVGYSRQEGVMMPLIANVPNANGKLVPCDADEIAACRLYALNGAGELEDSMSVIATFGATFAGGSGSQANASGGIAQTFATGAAAQLLALKGGAALVATGPAAERSAENDVSNELAALTRSPEVRAASGELVTRRNATRQSIAQHFAALSGEALTQEMSAVSQRAGFPESRLATLCARQNFTDMGACAREMAKPNTIIPESDVDDFGRALTAAPAGGE